MALPNAVETPTRVLVGSADSFVAGKPQMITVGRREIGVYRIGDAFRAILNFCPHEGIKICNGRVGGTFVAQEAGEFWRAHEGEVLACPWHGWEFNLLTGVSLHDPRCRLKSFSTEVHEGMVYVVI